VGGDSDRFDTSLLERLSRLPSAEDSVTLDGDKSFGMEIFCGIITLDVY